MMKRFFALLLAVCLCLPLFSQAETENALPEGYRLEEFDDFTLPVPSNGLVWRYDPETDDGWVAEIVYLDPEDPAFQPYMIIWRYPNNMSAYLRGVHPLDYGKTLTSAIVDSLKEDGCTVAAPRTVYGMCRGDVYYTMCTMRIEAGSLFAEEAHDLWVYQRYYGTYEMGTIYFEIYAPTRAHADAIIRDVEQAVFR